MKKATSENEQKPKSLNRNEELSFTRQSGGQGGPDTPGEKRSQKDLGYLLDKWSNRKKRREFGRMFRGLMKGGRGAE